MKNIKLLSFIFCISLQFLFSQNNLVIPNLNLEKQINLPKEFTNISRISKWIKLINSDFYILKSKEREYSSSDIVDLYKIDEKRTSKINFKLPNSNWIYNFTIDSSQQKLYILAQEFLAVYKLEGSNAIFENKVDLTKPYNDIKFENNKIVLLSNCYSCDNPGLRAAIYSQNLQLIKSYNFDSPKGYQLEFYQPSCRLDYYNGKFIVSDILDYKICIYDEQKNKIATLERNIECLSLNSKNKKEFNDLPHNSWQKQYKFNDIQNTSRLEKAQMVDDTTIFVMINDFSKAYVEKHSEFIFEIWRYNKISKKWYLFKDNLVNNKDRDQKAKIILEKFLGLSNSYIISNHKLISISIFPFYLSTLDLKNMTGEEYHKKVEDYLTKNDIVISLFIYSIK